MRKIVLFTGILLVCLFEQNNICFAQKTDRHKAISAYIYKFAQNVEWQNEDAIKDFHFLIIGDDESLINEMKNSLKFKTIRKKTIKVSSSSVLTDIDNVQLIFVTKGNEEKLGKINDMIEGKNILLVSDSYQDERIIMINFYDSQEGSLKFKINKLNISNHHITVMPDMILLGGTDVDVQALFYEEQQKIRNLQNQINTLNNNLGMLEKNLEIRSMELKSTKDSIKLQTLELLHHKKTLDEQSQLIYQQKNELQGQIKKILLQQKIYDQQSRQLTTQKSELQQGKQQLQNQKNELARQEIEIAEHDAEISSKSKSIEEQQTKLSRQRFFLSWLVIIVILFVALIAAIFILYRSKKKANRELEKRVLERTSDLNAINQQLQTELAERKLAEEALQKTEERYRLTLDNMLEGGQIIGFDFRYLYVNDAVTRQGLKTKKELLGHTMMEAYPGIENTAVFPAIKKCIKDRKAQHMINEFMHSDGSTGWFELSIQPVPEGVFILSNDISERKLIENKIMRLNEELEEKVALRTTQLENANKELEAFAYSVSHDLRAPLRAINGFTNILLEDYYEKFDTEGQRVCGVIQHEALRMGQLIDDLLAFSRLSRSPMQTASANMTLIAQQVADEVRDQYPGNKVNFHLADLQPAEVDVSLIRQVWINLISNAFKFSAKKEIIEIEVGCYEYSDEIVYFVKDNGAGFDMKYADKLFGVFQRLHNINEFYGTGVGLAIVQRIIKRHGGRVWAESEINNGAKFSFSLPIKK